LLNPDEIGRMLARVDDRGRPGYPGIVLALIPGEHPLLARRVNYYQSRHFEGFFDPHPNHPPPPTLAELAARPRGVPQLPRPSFPWHRVGALLRGIWRLLCALGGLVVFGVIVLLAIGIYVNSRETQKAGPQGDAAAPQAAVAPATPQTSSPATQNALPAVIPVEPPTAPSQPAQNSAYDQGGADWKALQAWFATQTGDRRAGADWWAAHRSHEPGPCDQAADEYSDNQQAVAQFESGCKDAKSWLDPIDRKRADPQYKSGFNDAAKLLPLAGQASATTVPTRFATVKTPDDLKLRTGPGVLSLIPCLSCTQVIACE